MNDMAIACKRRLFTVEEYHRLAEARVLGEHDAVELIDGELIEMPPIGPGHRSRHARITEYLIQTLRGRATVLPMGSFPLGERSEPQPDLAIFPYDAHYYARRPNPPVTEFLAFIEISDSSLAYDSGAKMRLYASHGLSDYLLVDVRGDRLIVHRDPSPDGYATVRHLGYGTSFALSQLTDVALSSDAFLDIQDG